MTDLPGVILAGGLSRRMGGGDKGLIKLGHKTILGRVIDKIEPQVSALAININGDHSRFPKYPYSLIPDSIGGFAGPLAGVLAGMDWAFKNNYQAIITLAADTPFLPEDLVKRLADFAERENSNITMASAQDPITGEVRVHPTFGLWNVNLREDLRKELMAGTRKIIRWAERHVLGYVEFKIEKPGEDPFFNINTPQDLIDAEDKLSNGLK